MRNGKSDWVLNYVEGRPFDFAQDDSLLRCRVMSSVVETLKRFHGICMFFSFKGAGLLWLLAPLLMLGSCKSKEQTAASATPESSTTVTKSVAEGPQVVASIERTACFGQCPIYRATFYDNGEVRYVGRHFVEMVGTFATLISTEELAEIDAFADTIGYHSFKDAYPTPITDFPTCITSHRKGDKVKTILNGEHAPSDLIGFERMLDGLLRDRDWSLVSESTTY